MAKTIEKPRKKPSSKPASPVQTDARKVLLLDGHSLAFRAFFALPDTLVTSSGQVTNAVYGFTAMLIKLLADERPQGVVVCFDKGAPQFRLNRYAEYKAGRAATPGVYAGAVQRVPSRQPFEAASAWLTCCAALVSAACGWLLPRSTDTTMLPSIWETFG